MYRRPIGLTDIRARAYLWLALLIASAIAVVAIAHATGFNVSLVRTGWLTAFAVVMGLGAMSWSCRNIAPRPALAVLSILILLVGGAAGGITSMTGQLFAFPLVDGRLAAVDRAIGLESRTVIEAIVRIPGAATALGIAYVMSLLALFMSTLLLACLGRFERVWETCGTFCACMAIAVTTAVVLPATGPFQYFEYGATFDGQLPGGSGIYYLPALNAIRGADSFAIDPFDLMGLVTFPSFHTVMALMTAAAWRDQPTVFWPMAIWNTLVVISTVPIGGHYIIDVIAGASCWALFQRYFTSSLASGTMTCDELTCPATVSVGMQPAGMFELCPATESKSVQRA